MPASVSPGEAITPRPAPFYGNAWEASLLRDFLANWLHNPFEAAIFREITELETLARRAVQAGYYLRRAADAPYALGTAWLTSAATVYRRRAQSTADEIDLIAHEADVNGEPIPTNMRVWAALVSANASAAACLEKAASIIGAPGGDQDTARALMRTAADRLDALRPAVR
ncbi:hypothetical protein ACWERV_32795 [Streptomyces sp. NPDC004031]